MIFVDTNYFLRFFLNDIPEQKEHVKKLFIAASERKEQLITSTVVFFEICWVLRSYYKKEKPQMIETLQKVLQLTFIHFLERDILAQSLMLFKNTNLDLEDCYNLYFAKSHKSEAFKTFDKKLAREFAETK